MHVWVCVFIYIYTHLYEINLFFKFSKKKKDLFFKIITFLRDQRKKFNTINKNIKLFDI